MAEMIKLTSAADDGFEFSALHAKPAGDRRGGVIVIQEIFGLDRYVHEDVARWAALGFEAVAPSMFDRAQPGFVAEHDPEGFAAAMPLRMATDNTRAMGDIAACIAFLAPRGPVFIVGYCYGGAIAWLASSELDGLAAASSYYGGTVAGMADLALKNPVICHFGRKDGHIPAEEVKAKLAEAHPNLPVYIYENSGHGFNNDGRPESDLADAELARERTLVLFAQNGAL